MQDIVFIRFKKIKQLFYVFSLFCIFTEVVNAANQYCGLNCLYTIMKMSGKQVEFSDLIKPEYIGSTKGSSLAEIKQAAEDNGLYAEAVKQLSGSVLKQCKFPIILHIKSMEISEEYDHYVLFLGMKYGKAKIFDPPNPVKLVTFAELATLWDGNGLIVSDGESINLGIVFAPARKRFILYSTIVIIIILMVYFLKRFLPVTLYNSQIKLFGISIVQAGCFTIVAILIGFIYHFTSEIGFLASASAILLFNRPIRVILFRKY